MGRILLIVLGTFHRTLYYFTKIFILSHKKEKDYDLAFQLIKSASIHSIKVARVTMEVEGVENIPKEDGFIYYPNHQGLFDVLLFYASSPKNFAFVIKKEASKVILLKQIIAATGSLVMDRKDLRQSVKIIEEMITAVKSKRNFLIFAEGTRSRNGNEVLDFKAGSFKAAIRSECPIVPCALIDSYRPFDEKGIKPLTVKLIYLKPITYEEYKDMKSSEIAGIVKDRIQKAITETLDKENAL